MTEREYSFAVCYNDPDQFARLCENLRPFGCRIYSVDNQENQHTIASAYNKMTGEIPAGIIVYLHQDVTVPPDWLTMLDEQISRVKRIDEQWAVIGLMGVREDGYFAGNIIDPHTQIKYGDLPCRVISVDEVCLVIQKEMKMSFDEELGGFHFYGADISLRAQLQGLKSYAIDAPLTHFSGGKPDSSYFEMAKRLNEKWSQIEGVPNTVETTCGVFKLKYGIPAFFEYWIKKIRRKFITAMQRRPV